MPARELLAIFSFRLFEHLKANAPEFTDLAGFQANTTPFGVRRVGHPIATTLPGAFVTANYFTLFGVAPAAGLMLTLPDDHPGRAASCCNQPSRVDALLRTGPSVIGSDVIVNGQPFTIVGIAAQPFFGDTVRPGPAAIWIPIGQEPRIRGAGSLIERADQHWLYAIGRVRPGSDPVQIRVRVSTALQQWLAVQPFVSERQRTEIDGYTIAVVPARGGVALARAPYEQSLNILVAASAMVLSSRSQTSQTYCSPAPIAVRRRYVSRWVRPPAG